MSFTITLENEAIADDLLDLLRNAPVRAIQAVVKGVAAGSQELLGLALRERFSGKGPFAVSQRKLGIVSGQLRKSLRFTRPEITGEGVVSTRAGSNLEYFAAHEFGFKGQVSVRQASVKNTTNRNAFGNNQFSVLAHTRKAHTRNVNIPRRAPLSTAIEEHSTRVFVKTIAKQLSKLIDQTA